MESLFSMSNQRLTQETKRALPATPLFSIIYSAMTLHHRSTNNLIPYIFQRPIGLFFIMSGSINVPSPCFMLLLNTSSLEAVGNAMFKALSNS